MIVLIPFFVVVFAFLVFTLGLNIWVAVFILFFGFLVMAGAGASKA